MAVGTTGAIIASALIGAASTAYSVDEQKKAAGKAEEARRAAEAEKKRIAADTKPEEQSLEAVSFGVQDAEEASEGFEEFFVRQSPSKLGGTGKSGVLGFEV